MLVAFQFVCVQRVVDMLVRQIMTSPAYSVEEGASLDTALRLMASARVTGLPVVDGDGRVVGIISEADLLKADLEPDPRAHLRSAHQTSGSPASTVGEAMSANPHTVREDSDVAELAHTFANTSWKSVPVVRGGVLLGVVSRSDVIRALSRSDKAIASEVGRILAEMGLRHWRVDVTGGVVSLSGSGSDRERAAATSIARSVIGVRHVASPVHDA